MLIMIFSPIANSSNHPLELFEDIEAEGGRLLEEADFEAEKKLGSKIAKMQRHSITNVPFETPTKPFKYIIVIFTFLVPNLTQDCEDLVTLNQNFCRLNIPLWLKIPQFSFSCHY